MKKNLKKALSTVFVMLQICMLICTTNSATVFAAGKNETPNYRTGVTSYSDLESRLNRLISKYQNRYWTTNGRAAKSNGSTSKYYHGIQCKGFASYIFNDLFCTGFIGAYDKNKYYIPNPNGAYLVGKAWNINASAAKRILSKGSIGDFIQVRRRGKSYGHSMILAGVDSGGIKIFDCNSDGKCGVKCYHQTWQTFASKNQGLSLYHSRKYPKKSSSSSGSNRNTINPINIGTGFLGYLINVNANKMVTNMNANAQLEEENAFRNQMWYFDRQSDGSYIITSAANRDLCLDVHNAGGSGTNVKITDKHYSNAQKWYIVGSQENCNLIPLCSQKCVLDASGGNTGRGTNIQIWEKNNTAAQKFRIWKIGNQPNKAVVTSDSRTYKENSDITFKWGETAFATSFWVDIWCDGKGIQSFGLNDTQYTFRNVKAGRYTIFVTSVNDNGQKVSDRYDVYVAADLGEYFQGMILRKDVLKPIVAVKGGNVEIGARNGDANELWNFYRQSDGSYIIKNLSNDKALDVYDWGGSGANVQVYTEGKYLQANQQWYICPSFGGCVFVPKHGSGLVLDCSSGSSVKGTNIQVWVDNETKAQIFTIYKKKVPVVMHLLPFNNDSNRIFRWSN